MFCKSRTSHERHPEAILFPNIGKSGVNNSHSVIKISSDNDLSAFADLKRIITISTVNGDYGRNNLRNQEMSSVSTSSETASGGLRNFDSEDGRIHVNRRGEPRLGSIRNQSVILVPLESKVRSMIVAEVSNSSHFATRTNGIVIQRNSNENRVSNIHIVRIAGNNTAISILSIDREDVRMILMREIGLENCRVSSQRVDNKGFVSIRISNSLLSRISINSIVVNTPFIVIQGIASSAIGRVIDISKKSDQTVITNERIASNHERRVRENQNRGRKGVLTSFATKLVDSLNCIGVNTDFRNDGDCVKVMTGDFNTILEPTISCKSIRSSFKGKLRTKTDRVTSSSGNDSNRFNIRNRIQCNHNRVRSLASTNLFTITTVRGHSSDDLIPSGIFSRGNSNGGTNSTVFPSIGNVINPLVSISRQSNRAARANRSGRSRDMHIGTELSNSERIGNDGAAIGGRSRHGVNTRINVNRVVSSAIRPAIGNCVKGISNQHSAVTVANNVVASNGQETRQSVNRIIGSSRNKRDTAIGVNNFGVHIVCTRDLVGKNQRVKVVTRNFNTVHIPNERTSSRGRSREDNLIIRTNGTSLAGRNGRSSRNRININHNSIRVGTATIRSLNIIQSISSRRSHINSRIVRTGVPGINNIGIKNIAEICSQSHVLTFADVGSGSCDVHIRTKGINIEGHDIGLTTISALGNHRVETRNSIISISRSKCTTIPRIFSCARSGSSELRRSTITNNLRTVDCENRRSGFNRHRNSLGNRRDTTVGIDDTSGDAVNTGKMTIKADRAQVLTRNFNTVHIPNEGCGGIRSCSDSSLRVLTHCHSCGRDCRSCGKCFQSKLDRVRIRTTTIRGLYKIFIICSGRENCDGGVMGTRAPSVNHIGINSATQIGAQHNRFATACINGGSDNVKISTDRSDGEGNGIRHTTIGALGNHSVDTRNSFES